MTGAYDKKELEPARGEAFGVNVRCPMKRLVRESMPFAVDSESHDIPLDKNGQNDSDVPPRSQAVGASKDTTLLLGGDVMLGRGVNEALKGRDPARPWRNILPFFLNADASVINLECAVTRREEKWNLSPKAFYFRADPEMLKVLQAARITACTLANNHILDFQVGGLRDTLRYLDEEGLCHAGAGETLEQAMSPRVFTARSGRRIGLVSASDNEPLFAASTENPGINFIPVTLESEYLVRIQNSIAGAREQGADVVIFSDHWGPNMIERPRPLFRRFAHAVVDRGADIFHGHSAHVCQGVEIYRNRIILYDTGNLLDDYAVDPDMRNDWSFLFLVTLRGARPAGLTMIPLKLSYAAVERAEGLERKEILERMLQLSKEMGTTLFEKGGHLQLQLNSESHGERGTHV